MNRKDIVSLMEAYEDILVDQGVEASPEDELGLPMHGSSEEMGNDEEEMFDDAEEEMPEHEEHGTEDFEDERMEMVEAHLHTIRSHAHEIFGCLERGAQIEPWMEEKIAIANDYIVHVANAIMYRK